MVEITWLGHAMFQFRLESGEVIVLDPWIEGNPKYPAKHEFTRVDAILVTHGHSDHIADAVSLSKKFKAKVVSIYETSLWLASKGAAESIGIGKGGTLDLGMVKVTMTHAIHSNSIQDGDKILYGGEPAGYVIHFPDRRKMYCSGDTNVFSDMQLIEKLYQPDLAILPIGDYYTMGPREAALACRMLKPKKMIPMHFGTFPVLSGTPEQVAKLLKDFPQTKVWPLEIGVAAKW